MLPHNVILSVCSPQSYSRSSCPEKDFWSAHPAALDRRNA